MYAHDDTTQGRLFSNREDVLLSGKEKARQMDGLLQVEVMPSLKPRGEIPKCYFAR